MPPNTQRRALSKISARITKTIPRVIMGPSDRWEYSSAADSIRRGGTPEATLPVYLPIHLEDIRTVAFQRYSTPELAWVGLVTVNSGGAGIQETFRAAAKREIAPSSEPCGRTAIRSRFLIGRCSATGRSRRPLG
jgi:hypothetical protein